MALKTEYEEYDPDVGVDRDNVREARNSIREEVKDLCEKLEKLAKKLLAKENELLTAKGEQGIAQEPVSPVVAARGVNAHLLHFESLPVRRIGCELVGQREVDDCALVDLVALVCQHAVLPAGARHIDLLTEVVHRLRFGFLSSLGRLRMN